MTSLARIALSPSAPAAFSADALVVGLAAGRGRRLEVLAPGLTTAARTRIAESLTAVRASANPGDVTRIPGGGPIAATAVVGVGLGDIRTDPESLRRAVGNAIRSLSGVRRVGVALPTDDDDDTLLHVAMAALLASYEFAAFKGKASAAPSRTITLLVGARPSADQKRIVAEATSIAEAVSLTRDLVNTPPNALPPTALAEAGRQAVRDLPVKVRIWDVPALRREGCGGILAVGQGSANPPRLLRLAYAPRGATRHLALVGKGITFDTGGISIKPAANMDEMKGDMAGAAAVIGAVKAIAELGLPIRVTGWVPTAENMPSGTAQRPGDVITIYGGTTVEVLNTDAEGRLVLADALGLAAQEEPDLIIDVATLTGAQRIALGTRTAGAMSNDDDARDAVCAAAGRAGEQVWPMPLPDELRATLDSSTADLANVGDRLGGMLSAGVFLREFVPADQPWVHLDIAGPAFNERTPYGYTPKGGTGAAVRTMIKVAAEMADGTS